MERELLEYVQAEYGYQMPNTIQACCQRIYRQKLADIFSVPIGRALLESTDCSAVVVGSPTVPCRGLIHAATESDTAAFLVPHGITRPREPLVPAGTTMFLPGNLGETYLEEMFPPERLPRLVVTGRPYLEAQHRHRRESYAPSGEPLRIVIATQQFSDFVRETFLRETLRGLERVAYPVEAVIKTHPSESTGLYEEILEDVDAKDGRRIRIEETGLEDHVKRACLLLTINSNVGLESIVLGTPCVSVNLFKPYVPTYPYARGEAVPELTSRDEIEAFFETLDLEVLKSLQARQEPFLEENYELDGEAADRIVTHIRASLE